MPIPSAAKIPKTVSIGIRPSVPGSQSIRAELTESFFVRGEVEVKIRRGGTGFGASAPPKLRYVGAGWHDGAEPAAWRYGSRFGRRGSLIGSSSGGIPSLPTSSPAAPERQRLFNGFASFH